MKQLPTLILLPSLMAKQISSHEIVVTKKFIDGVSEYQKYWDGDICVFLEEDTSLTNNLDNMPVDLDSLPFKVKLVNYDFISAELALITDAVVLASVYFRQNHIAKVCQSLGIPCIYVSEYSLKTRIQIVNATYKGLFKRFKKYVWESIQEIKQILAIYKSQGVQCNGTPTFNFYRKICRNSLLYFDTRVNEDMLISENELLSRTEDCKTGRPLRLLFSGRLIQIKGADHLIAVAQKLVNLGVNFKLTICGDGDLLPQMKKDIEDLHLSQYVEFLGVLEFKTELVPLVKNSVDLFVCCHIQGDPSCTYLETMSCGVPIVGYGNEAFKGLVDMNSTGWYVNANKPRLLAEKIAQLNSERSLIVEHSFKALGFAKQHTFEKTFQRRIEHIHSVIE